MRIFSSHDEISKVSNFRWNRLVSTSSKVMSKFVLRICRNAEAAQRVPDIKFEHLMSLERHFTSAYISWKGDGSKLIQVIERLGKRIKKVELKYKNWSSETIVEVLEKLPELEILYIEHWGREVVETSANSVLLKKLKKLQVNAAWEIFFLIKTPMLLNLTLISMKEGLDLRIIGDFLKNSPKLESLTASCKILGVFGSNFPIQLKKLELDLDFDFNENSKQFLLSQAEFLESLDARCEDSKFLELVFTKCKRLKSLNTDMSTLAASRSFYENLKPLQLQEIISIGNGFSSEIAMQAVIKNCPELKKLDIFRCYLPENYFKFMANSNKKLQSLSMHTIKNPGASFEHLKTLKLTTIVNMKHLLDFLKANPTIENLNIRSLPKDFKNVEALGGLVDGTNLKHFNVGGEDSLLKKIFNMFSSRFASTKIVRMEFSWSCLQIYIPRDVYFVEKGGVRVESKLKVQNAKD